MRVMQKKVFGVWSKGMLLFALGGLAGCSSVKEPNAPNRTEAESGPILFAQGNRALQQGDHTRAEQYFRLSFDQGYQPSKTITLLVRVCLATSRFRGALNYAEPYLLEHPDEHALRFLVATVHTGLGQDGEAVRHLNQLSRRAPTYADTYYLRGVMRAAQNDPLAQADLQLYLEISPDGERASEVAGLLEELEAEKRAAEEARLSALTPVPGREPTISDRPSEAP